jgi:lipoprotein-anchoring transpeptidase ErfK/SrfK
MARCLAQGRGHALRTELWQLNRPRRRKFHRSNVSGVDLDSFAESCGPPELCTPRARCSPREILLMHIRQGQTMIQRVSKGCRPSLRAVAFAGIMLLAPVAFCGAANAQALGYAAADPGAFPRNDAVLPGADESVVPERLRRAIVAYDGGEAAGTMVIDTGNTVLYYVLGGGRAIRYGVGVGREGFTWSGTQTVTRKAEWPDWHPPVEMIARQPYLPRFMAGGPGNPLGARAMYLGASEYRIHGTNDPSTIGKFVSSGCIRLTNEDVSDLFSRVNVGTKVVVLPKHAPLQARGVISARPAQAQARPVATRVRPVATQGRPVVTTLPSGRQAMNLSTSTIN